MRKSELTREKQRLIWEDIMDYVCGNFVISVEKEAEDKDEHVSVADKYIEVVQELFFKL